MSGVKIASYSCTCMPGISKVSKMKPNEKGYYRHILGGFNLSNESGVYYPMTDTVKKLFEETGLIRRRIEKGMLRSESGHPDLTGLSHVDALKRLAHIDTTRTCAHIKEVELVQSKDHKGKDVVLVYGWVKPSGPYGTSLKDQLDNPEENVAFSVRSFCQTTMYRGRIAKLVTDVLTYDNVSEPGIGLANQYDTVSLEELDILGGRKELHFTEEDFVIPDNELITMESELVTSLTMIKDNQGWNRIQMVEGVTSTNW